jgi:hypothetical protein
MSQPTARDTLRGQKLYLYLYLSRNGTGIGTVWVQVQYSAMLNPCNAGMGGADWRKINKGMEDKGGKLQDSVDHVTSSCHEVHERAP